MLHKNCTSLNKYVKTIVLNSALILLDLMKIRNSGPFKMALTLRNLTIQNALIYKGVREIGRKKIGSGEKKGKSRYGRGNLEERNEMQQDADYPQETNRGNVDHTEGKKGANLGGRNGRQFLTLKKSLFFFNPLTVNPQYG